MPKFTGPLAEPIIRQDYVDHDYLGFPEAWRDEIMGGVPNRRREDAASRRAIAQENKRIEKVKAEKMLLLAEHYGTRKNGRTDWCQLARHLADALDIVGLTVKSRPPNTDRPAGMKGPAIH